jgi:hypothetical protein
MILSLCAVLLSTKCTISPERYHLTNSGWREGGCCGMDWQWEINLDPSSVQTGWSRLGFHPHSWHWNFQTRVAWAKVLLEYNTTGAYSLKWDCPKQYSSLGAAYWLWDLGGLVSMSSHHNTDLLWECKCIPYHRSPVLLNDILQCLLEQWMSK